MVTPPRIQHQDGRVTQLTGADFVAAGGQGAVYRRGATAYKVFHRPADVPSPKKIAELASVRSRGVVTPTALVFDAGRTPIGYEMSFVEHATPLAQLCTVAHRTRVGFSILEGLRLFDAIAALLHQVHAAGCVVVDLSDTNIVVAGSRPYLIDADSWQTPSALATAITPSVTDPSHQAGTRFSPQQDWFAFAVVGFALLTGVHPFKGKHPSIRGLAARMAAGVSVLDPAVRVPAHCTVDDLPDELKTWFADVFTGRHRRPPPAAENLGRAPRLRSHAPVSAAAFTYAEPPSIVASSGGSLLAATPNFLYVDRLRIPLRSAAAEAVGLLESGVPYSVHRGSDGCIRVDVLDATPTTLETSIRADEIRMTGDRIYALRGAKFFELTVRRVGSRVRVLPWSLGSVMPLARQLFEGVLIQRPCGQARATLLGPSACAPQLRLPPLDRATIVDACHHRGVLRVLTAIDGRFDRHTITVGLGGSRDVQTDRDVDPTACQIVVGPDGSVVTCDDPEAGARGAAGPIRASPAASDGLILHAGQVFTLTGVHLRHVAVLSVGN